MAYLVWNHMYDFRPKLHDTKSNYQFIKSVLKLHCFKALNFRFWFNLVCKTMSFDENSLKPNKQTSSSEVRTKTVSFDHRSFIRLSCIKVRFSSHESMMEDLPFFCGWRWDFSLSLEKELEGAADVILRWLSFWVLKLPRLHDVFSFKNTDEWHSA